MCIMKIQSFFFLEKQPALGMCIIINNDHVFINLWLITILFFLILFCIIKILNNYNLPQDNVFKNLQCKAYLNIHKTNINILLH